MSLAWPEPHGWLRASLPSWPRAVPAIFKPSGEGTDTNPTTAPTHPTLPPHSLHQQPPRSAGTHWDPQAGARAPQAGAEPPDKWLRLLGSALPSHQGCPKGMWGQRGAGWPLPASSREAPCGGSGSSRGGRSGAAAHPPPGPGYCCCQTAGCYELCGGSVSVAMAADLFYFSQLPPLRAPSKKHPPRAPASSPVLRAPRGRAASPRCPRGTSTAPASSLLGDEAQGTRSGARGQRQVMLEAAPRCPNVGLRLPGGACGGALGLVELPRSFPGLGQGGPSLGQGRHRGS